MPANMFVKKNYFRKGQKHNSCNCKA